MNERIRQLAEQAGFMDSWFSESGDDCEQELKKFAELIVQECAGRVDHILRERQAGGGTMGDDIREHFFGVEE
jgi:hypothetical protein